MTIDKGGKILVIGDRVKYKGKWNTLICLTDTSFTICLEGSNKKSDLKTFKGNPYYELYKERY